MGLREKVALAISISVLTQILFTRCMPRSHFKFAPNTKNIKSPKICDRFNEIKMPIREAPTFAAINDSVVIRFPDVEYPSSSQDSEYYRFQNDYPSEFPPHRINSSRQACLYKRQPKCQHMYATSTKTKSKSELTTTIMENDPLSRPHCISESLFPEVDYPLSARDLWLPKQKSPSQDAKSNSIIETDIIESKSATEGKFSIYDPNEGNLKLSSLIKELNTKKKSSLETLNSDAYSKLIHPKKTNDLDNAVNLNISPVNSGSNIEQSIAKNDVCSQAASSTPDMPNSEINPVIAIPKNEPSVYIVIIKTSIENGNINPVLSVSEENQGSQDNKSLTSSPTNTDVYPISLNNSLSDIFTNIISLSIKDNSDIRSELIIPEKSLSSHDDIISDLSQKSLLDNNGDIVTTTTNSDTSDNICQLINPKESQGFSDNIHSTNTTETNCNIIPEPPKTCLFNDIGDIFTMATLPWHNTSELSIPKENNDFCDNIASKVTTVIDINPVPFTTSSLQDCGDLVSTITNAGSSVISGQLIPEEKKRSDAKISSKITNVNNNDIIPTSVQTSLLANCDQIVTTVTDTDTSDISQLITLENQISRNHIVSAINTDASLNNLSQPSKISSLSDCGDIFTTTTNATISNIVSDISIANENEKSRNDIIAKSVNVTHSDTIPGLSKTCSLGDCGDTYTTMINLVNTSQLLINKENQSSHENIVSANTAVPNSSLIITGSSSVTADSIPIISTSKVLNCSGHEMPPKPNNYFDSLDKEISQNVLHIAKNNLAVKYTTNSTISNGDSNENNNPQELLNNNQDLNLLRNTNIGTEYENFDANDPVFTTCSSVVKTKNEKLRENSNNTSIVSDVLPTVTEHPDDLWLIFYDTDNSTQDTPDYEAVYYITGSITNEGSFSVVVDAVDPIMYVQDANSTLQQECTDLCASYNEKPYNPDYVNDV